MTDQKFSHDDLIQTGIFGMSRWYLENILVNSYKDDRKFTDQELGGLSGMQIFTLIAQKSELTGENALEQAANLLGIKEIDPKVEHMLDQLATFNRDNFVIKSFSGIIEEVNISEPGDEQVSISTKPKNGFRVKSNSFQEIGRVLKARDRE